MGGGRRGYKRERDIGVGGRGAVVGGIKAWGATGGMSGGSVVVRGILGVLRAWGRRGE